ncbi:MAG TPA: hypothetical protein VK588_03580 [Chitinophagaceae bacterium]|nr:hypothetical protein [Chitinophagaceae bacterium]
MYYYTFSALIFAKGQIRDGLNLLYRSEKPATIIEFKNEVKHFHAGLDETYSAIVIPTWQEIDEATYNHIKQNE